MNEKELDKSLNKTVKPGTEQIALNTAQTQANQLLTEQTMNLQAERQVMTSNSERDVELRGAIELGAMNEAQPQPQPQVQALPPQAAGLRPETQQLLAKYGVNPNITESAKTTSNSSQTRTANNKMQVIPNKQGGETRVTNTTNITNITNNNSRVETKVDMPKQPAVLPPGPPAKLAPVAVGAAAGMAAMASHNKFKTFLNNLFAKRDHERQLQEREFRRRDWSIQRMSRKVMERMNSISEKFASKMNPEKIGSTFTSQIKLFLSMVGLTLLPKVWPAIIKGIDGISGFLSDIKTAWTSEDGGVIKKLGAVGSTIVEKLTNGIMSIGGTIVGSIEGIATKVVDKLTDVLAGTDYDEVEKKAKGLLGILGDRLVNFFGGNSKETTFPQMLKSYFLTLAKDIKNIFDVMAEDRATAIKSVWDRDKDKGIFKGGSLTSITRLLNNLPALLAAAIGGHRGLQNNSMYNAQQKSKEELFSGSMEEGTHYNKFTGKIKNSEGAKFMATNLAEAHSNENSNSVLHAEGIKKLYEFSESTNNSISIDKVSLEKIINKISKTEEDKKRLTEEIDYAIDKKLITAVAEQGISPKFVTATKTDKVIKPTGRITYTITKDAVPTFLSLLSGQSDGITFKLKDGEDLNDLMKNNKAYLENLIYDNYKSYVMNIDKQFMNKSWVTKSSLNNFGYLDAMETADHYSEQLDKAFNKFVDDTGVEWFYNEKIKKWIPSIGPTQDQLNKFHLKRNAAWAYTYNNAENLPKIVLDTAIDTAKNAYNTVTGSKVTGKVGDFVDYSLNEANFGSNPYYGEGQGPLNLPESNPTTYLQYNWNQGTYNQVPVKVNQPPVTAWSDVDESVTDAPSAAVAKSREKRTEFTGEIKRNNPGNIRPNSLKGFNTYSSLDDGFSAMFNKLIRWFQSAPKSERAVQLGVAGKPANTINEFIRVWAPAADNNNEENYVRFVENYTGIGRDYRIDPRNESDMKAIVEAMTIMEHTGGKKLTEGMLASLDKGWENRTAEVKAVNVDAPANQTLYAEGKTTDQKSSSDNVNGLLASLGDMGGYFEDLITQDDIDLLYGTPSTSTMTAARIDSPSDDLVASNIVSASYPTMPSAKMDAVKIDDTIEPEAVETESVADVVPPAIMDNSTHHSDNSQTIINNNIILDSGKDLFTERRTLGFSLA